MKGTFTHFKGFADFVLGDKALIAEIATVNLAISRENKLPLLTFYSHLTEVEFLEFSRQTVIEFLQQVSRGTALETSMDTLRQWKTNQHPFIPSMGVEVTDVVLIYSLRKQLYLTFLPRYTQDTTLFSQLALELETFHRELERVAFEAFVELQQQALRAEKELTESIINNSAAGIMAFDLEERFVIWNKALEQRYGKPKDQVLGKKFLEIYPQLENTEEGSHLGKALQGETIHTGELPYPQRYGWYEASVIPLRDAGGKTFGAVSVVQDITSWKSAQLKLQEQQEEILTRNQELLDKQHELRQAYEQLKEQEHFISSVTDAVPNIIFIYDLVAQKNIYTNKEVYNIFGYSPEEVIAFGSNFFTLLVHPEDMPIIQERSRHYQQMKEGDVSDITYRYKNNNGEYRYLRSKSRIYKFTPDGKPWQVLGTTEDVTDKVQQEQALRQSRDYYLTILEDFPSLIWKANTEGLCDYFNKSWLEYRGRTMEQEYGHGWAEGVHPDDFDRCLDIYNKNFKARTAFLMEYRMLRHDGAYRWIIDHGKPLYDLDGNFTGFLGACFDIQDRKDFENSIKSKNAALSVTLNKLRTTQEQLVQANETLELRVQKRTRQLAAGEKQLRLITDALPTLISYVDHQEVYQFVNKTYSLWFGKPIEEIEGKTVKSIIGPESYAKMQARLQQALSGQEVKAEDTLHYANGVSKTVSINMIPHVDSGTVKGFYALIYDITEIRKARESLEQALTALTDKNLELTRINTDLDNFIYTASHDLRSPVVNLEGLLLSLQKRLKDADSKDIQQLMGMMSQSISRLNRTILDLTDITKAQRCLDEAEEKIDIKEKLEGIKADLQPIIQEAEPVINADLQVTTITYSKRNLRSILYNLLTNALKYRSPDRRLKIEIKTYVEDGFVVLSVQDNGLGMNEQQLPKLFTMFKRLHTHVEGTGIGLYIIKRLVENGGGRIEVSSTTNAGSTFKVFLTRITQTTEAAIAE